MFDFLMISTRSTKRGVMEIYPKWIVNKSNDLMIRGGDFYAVWVAERGLWSTEEQDVVQLVDQELDRYAEENKQRFEGGYRVLHMWDAESGIIDTWHKYCQRQMRDSFHMLDEKLIFSNSKATKRDYASKRLSYPLEECETPSWDRLTSVLYAEEERHKIEWAIGSVVSGDSKKVQKFMVLYGAAGTGKSTILNVIQQLFEGYTAVFDAKALGSTSNAFALEAFRGNPLVAIQHDGDLSRIEDNTRLNSLVSHEMMTVNEKFKSTYSNSFKCFLFMGTNKPVKITDAKSGLLRRLIDVSPTGDKLPPGEYRACMKQIGFELGGIALKCQRIYKADPAAYDDYIPLAMLGASNDFYNFVLDSWYVFKKEDETTLKAAWEMYKTYCEDARVPYPYSQKLFKEELKNYFREYKERVNQEDGTRVRSHYSGFRHEKFEADHEKKNSAKKEPCLIQLSERSSLLDKLCADCPAQYASDAGTPVQRWESVTTRLADLDTSLVHYVRIPENHIVIDFDIPDDDGGKSLQKNLEEASKWPPTYAEVSKSGKGVHLHYLYTGDVSMLSRVYSDHVEVKIFTGLSSLRRRLSLCNNLPVASISSGLPLREENKVVNFDAIKSEKAIRTLIRKNLNKEIHAGTKPSMDFIQKILDDAYSSGMHYDVSDMRTAILAFAAGSTNQAEYCIRLVGKMKFKSEEPSPSVPSGAKRRAFFDVEVFSNVAIVCWKFEGPDNPVVRMVNPTPAEIEKLMEYNLVGFNCRRYDNHILYAMLMGYTNEQLYHLSQKIVTKGDGYFSEAYSVSETDVFDFSSVKQSLKKFEIELGCHHQELGMSWDEPVPEDKWNLVAEYCANDVIATEKVFLDRKDDFLARQILADVAGMTVNDTTNSLTTRIIFGSERRPQGRFNYRNLALPVRP
jgi:energy-coupling factor transporter ATP-binding protein EcfA2